MSLSSLDEIKIFLEFLSAKENNDSTFITDNRIQQCRGDALSLNTIVPKQINRKHMQSYVSGLLTKSRVHTAQFPLSLFILFFYKEKLMNGLYSSMCDYTSNVSIHTLLHFFLLISEKKRQQDTYSFRTIDYYTNYSCLVFSTLLPFY